MSKVAGIIGGMGPEATVDLLARIIRATPARDDQDHIRTIVDNNPQVPSRIRAAGLRATTVDPRRISPVVFSSPPATISI